jgi:hypothetical protein
MPEEIQDPAAPVTPTEAPATSVVPAKRANPLPLYLGGGFIFFLVALALLVAIPAEAQKTTLRQKLGDGVAAALVSEMLQPSSPRLNRLAERVAKDGKYDKVTLTAPDGQVLGSTDRTLSGTKLEEAGRAEAKTTIRFRGPVTVLTRGVYLAEGNKIGAVVLEFREK